MGSSVGALLFCHNHRFSDLVHTGVVNPDYKPQSSRELPAEATQVCVCVWGGGGKGGKEPLYVFA
jgi:hypothetical protein